MYIADEIVGSIVILLGSIILIMGLLTFNDIRKRKSLRQLRVITGMIIGVSLIKILNGALTIASIN